MAVPRDRNSLIKFYKRQYTKSLKDLQDTIASELKGIQDDGFVSSTAIQTLAMNAIVAGQRLNALTELDDE